MVQRSQPDLIKLAENVSHLQQNMAQVGALVDRLDVTIEKLTEVSTAVSQLLAVQGNRLEFTEKVQEKLQELVEKRRDETENYVKDLYGKIDKVEKDLYVEIEASQGKVLQEIKDMRAESNTQHNELKNKVQGIEKWMWTFIGGGAAIGFIISRIPWAAIIG
jgi:hypothetical protein